ncbi:hypothetical protein [Bradyrhizobium sp. 153]|uniref:hypothetical protein n=1 Tax=Bradyrhizobium sp. 153 TaxID=2782627 RepID=UPI001FFC1ED5|nr:hypothetical protein [Bradyrhizobium sp. 153]MCK1666576.1 hypothetical protein [Bradyrhizobium sp. 153]
MPIIRYFVVVGGLLLALLFAAGRYLPAPIEHAGATDPDRTTIRISSARSLPEKIVFDTRPRIDEPKIAQAEPIPEPQEQVREAMVAIPAAPPAQIRREPPARTATVPHPKRSAKLSKRVPPDRHLAFERHDPFSGGWW